MVGAYEILFPLRAVTMRGVYRCGSCGLAGPADKGGAGSFQTSSPAAAWPGVERKTVWLEPSGPVKANTVPGGPRIGGAMVQLIAPNRIFETETRKGLIVVYLR